MQVTNDEFDDMTVQLATDVQTARDHYNLFWGLEQSKQDYLNVLNQTPAFWQLTLKAHWQTALTTLCRVYDKSGGAFSLKEWLEAIKDSKTTLFQTQPDDKEILADIATVVDSDPLVGTLIKWRNKIVAHTDFHGIRTQTDWAKLFPMNYGQFKGLIERVFHLLNKYTRLRSKSTYGGLFGNDDYKWVLKTLKNNLK